MARPIWTGNLSFGLLNVPVSLMSGTRGTDLSFRMLDARDRKPIRFERVNADTGELVATVVPLPSTTVSDRSSAV